MAETKIAMSSEPTSKRPVDTDFQQQRLRAWQPLLTPVYVIITFLLIGVLFIILGVVVLSASNSVVETAHVQYDQLGASASIDIEIPADMSGKVYFYYELENFYQNHRRYVKSRSDSQLKNSDKVDTSTCDPLVYANHITYDNGSAIDKSYQLYPCGLIAMSKFNDLITTITLTRAGSTPVPYDASPSATGASAFWTNKGIAWKSDLSDKFASRAMTASESNVSPLLYPKNGTEQTLIDEELMVWMRTAGLPKFKKLHRIVNDNISLKKGDKITLTIDNRFPVRAFEGKKYFLFSTTSWLGGKNDFLGYAYIVVAVICLVLAIGFFIKHKVSPRPLGDMKYFNWPGTAAKPAA